jgi:tRNA G26 N,N-dimethylase Trm1
MTTEARAFATVAFDVFGNPVEFVEADPEVALANGTLTVGGTTPSWASAISPIEQLQQ